MVPDNSISKSKIALSEAVRVFSNQDKWRAYKSFELPMTETLETAGTIFGALFNSVVGDDEEKAKADKDLESVKGYGQRVKPGADALRELKKTIVAELCSGNLVAEGYFLPRHPQDDRILIPSDVWKGYPSIKWHLNTVKGQGMDFTHVVVSKASAIISQPITLRSEELETPEPRKQGRPSVKGNILEAYEALRDAGQIDYSGPKTALFGPICDWLVRKNPERKAEFKGMDNSTIRKAIANQFDIDRSKA